MSPLMNQAWTSCLLISIFTLVISTASEQVTLSSSIDLHGRTKVCPNEIVLYECFVMGPQLVWKLPGIFQQYYNENSDKNIVNNTGSVSVWLTGTNSTSEHLNSTMVLMYAPNINNASVHCNNKTAHYIVADNPESPGLDDPILIGQYDTSVYYRLQWSHSSNTLQDLDHYTILIIGNEVSKVFVSALDNKTIISANSGVATTIAIIAVNKCGQKSPQIEKHLNTTFSMKHSYIVYILAALAVLFCLICIVLMVIILIFVFRRLKHTNNLMRMKPAKPISKRSDVESHELNKKSEGFPLLGSRGSDRESS